MTQILLLFFPPKVDTGENCNGLFSPCLKIRNATYFFGTQTFIHSYYRFFLRFLSFFFLWPKVISCWLICWGIWWFDFGSPNMVVVAVDGILGAAGGSLLNEPFLQRVDLTGCSLLALLLEDDDCSLWIWMHLQWLCWPFLGRRRDKNWLTFPLSKNVPLYACA